MGGVRAWLAASASATVVMAAMAVVPSVASANWWEPGQAELENDRQEIPDWAEATEVGPDSATIVATFLPSWHETNWSVEIMGPMCVYEDERWPIGSGVLYEELSRCEGGELDEEGSPSEREYHWFGGWYPYHGTILGEGTVVGANPEETVTVRVPTSPTRQLVPGQKYLAYVRTLDGEGMQGGESNTGPPAFTTAEPTSAELRQKAKQEAKERRAKLKREREAARQKRKEARSK